MRFWFSEIRNRLGQAALIGMALYVTTEVILRYIFNSPTIFATDVTTFLMLAMTFLGLSYAERRGAHVSVNVIVRLLPDRVQARLSRVNWVIEFGWAVVFCVCVYLAAQDFYDVQTRSLSTEWLLYPFAIIMIVGAILLVVELAGENRGLLPYFRRRKSADRDGKAGEK